MVNMGKMNWFVSSKIGHDNHISYRNFFSNVFSNFIIVYKFFNGNSFVLTCNGTCFYTVSFSIFDEILMKAL